MASEKILESKREVVAEITNKLKNSESVILFKYSESTVSDMQELRRDLKNIGSEVKVYKNTLMARAFDDLKIDLNESLEGPSALAYGEDAISPIKVLADFAKTHPAMMLKVGIVDGEKSDQEALQELAKIPSREGLLTMLAGGMIQIAKDLSICLDLYAQQKEGE